MSSIMLGDTVTVRLPYGRPSGLYRGIVREMLPNYNWSGDMAALVTGNDPAPFEVITRVSNLAACQIGEKE